MIVDSLIRATSGRPSRDAAIEPDIRIRNDVEGCRETRANESYHEVAWRHLGHNYACPRPPCSKRRAMREESDHVTD